MYRLLQNPQLAAKYSQTCIQTRPLHTVRGTILKTIFKAADNDFAVVQLRIMDVTSSGGSASEAELTPGSSLLVAGKGGLSMFEKGPVIVKGNLSDHPTFGRQLKCVAASHIIDSGGNIASEDRLGDAGAPAPQAADVEAFLASGLCKGVGPKRAQRIVAQLGPDTMDVLNDVDGSFHRLGSVRGVGPSLLRSLKQQWQLRKSSQELITFLQQHGAGVGLAHRCTQAFGSAAAALAVLRGDPYQLALRVPRVGFPTADKLAQSIHGRSHSGTAPARVHAGVVHCLQTAVQEGHTCLPLGQTLDNTAKLLGLQDSMDGIQHVRACIQRLVAGGHLVAHAGGAGAAAPPDTLLALPWSDAAESAVASRIQQLQEWNTVWEPSAGEGGQWGGVSPDPLATHGVQGDAVWSGALRQALVSVQRDTGMALSSEQVHAVASALRHPVCIITGGPGTGKTAALRALVETWRLMGRRVALACPTARAAHRVNAAIGIKAGQGGADGGAGGVSPGYAVPPATTLHKLLEYGTSSMRPLLSAGGEAGFGSDTGAAEGGDGEGAVDGAAKAWSPLDRFGRNKERPLDADACVVDEASMLDVELAAGLFGAVRSMPPGAMSGGLQNSPPRAGMSVVLVGDADQLPSVGAGSVFRDLIESGAVPVCELRTMFRQAARSSIKQSAAQVNRGEVPRLMTPLDKPHADDTSPPLQPAPEDDLVQDCFFVHSASAEDVARNVVEVALEHALAAGHAPEDIQVLAPMRRGAAGTDELNKRLQALLNPWHALLIQGGGEGVGGGLSLSDEEAAALGTVPSHVRSWLASSVGFCLGDRVMQMSNDYGKGVINGDMGCVTSISWTGGAISLQGGRLHVQQRGGGSNSSDSNGKRRWWQSSRVPHAAALSRGARVTVTFDAASASAGGQVQYTLGEAARSTALAYATTVHKAQGNEWPAVICALHGSHWAMLSRGVLYTALSRAQCAAYVVGTRQAMGIAAKNVAPNERNTLLKLKLQGLQASSADALQAPLAPGAASGADGGTGAHGVPWLTAERKPPPSTGPLMHSSEMALQSDLAWALHCVEEGGGGHGGAALPQSDVWTQQSLARDRAWRDLNICSALVDEEPSDAAEDGVSEGGVASAPASAQHEDVMSAAEAAAVLSALQGARGDPWWALGLEGALQVGASLDSLLPPQADDDR